jgi:hypothetical protein
VCASDEDELELPNDEIRGVVAAENESWLLVLRVGVENGGDGESDWCADGEDGVASPTWLEGEYGTLARRFNAIVKILTLTLMQADWCWRVEEEGEQQMTSSYEVKRFVVVVVVVTTSSVWSCFVMAAPAPSFKEQRAILIDELTIVCYDHWMGV